MLITGGLGFIGSNFVNFHITKYPDQKIIVLDKMDYCSSMKNVDDNNNVKIIVGNILDKHIVQKILYEHNIHTIIHFAAQSHVDNSFYNSITFTENNILGTHILLETTKEYNENTNNIKKFIHVSTDEVYGEVTDDVIRTETSILDPTNPYAASKAGAEFIVKSYLYSYKLPIIITRANNVYGKNQYPEKVIPKFICQLLNNEKITLHGKGEAQRNFIHVDDVCSAYDTILKHGEIGEIYNISAPPDHELSMLELAETIIKQYDPNLKDVITFVEDRKFNDTRYYTCSKKLEKLGWYPTNINFKENILELINWYRINRSRYQ